MDQLSDFDSFLFDHDGVKRTVFRKGDGPGVVIMHEVPGVSTEVLRFARKVVDAGFTVFLPHLFGILGRPTNEFTRIRELAKLCISREWHVLAENRSSPVAEWLRALARRVQQEIGGKGVGAVGMCVTGNFALTMTLDQAVIAPVLAHPSFPLPLTATKAAALHVTPRRWKMRGGGSVTRICEFSGSASPETCCSAGRHGLAPCGASSATALKASKCPAVPPNRTLSRRTACSQSGSSTK